MTTRYARINRDEGRIAEIFSVPEGEEIVPYAEETATLGENEVHGAAEVRLENDRAVAYTPAVRALSGVVAILDDAGNIVETRDLGSDLIPVSANVHPFREEKPDFDPATHVLDANDIVLDEDGVITRIWYARKLTKAELSTRADDLAAQKRRRVERDFGKLGLQAAFEQDNRLRKLEGQPLLTLDQFVEAEAAKL